MPLFLDIHTTEGPVSIDDVAHAHAADLQVQGRHGVHYLRYWVDQTHGKVFCLVDAPDAGTAATVHREAYGLVADEIYPVAEGALHPSRRCARTPLIKCADGRAIGHRVVNPHARPAGSGSSSRPGTSRCWCSAGSAAT